MAEQHTNILRYMYALRSFNDNDLDEASKYCSENIVYRIAGRSQIAGEYPVLNNQIRAPGRRASFVCNRLNS